MVDIELMGELHEVLSSIDRFNSSFDELFCRISSSTFGMGLLQYIENKFGRVPSRVILDFLLKSSGINRDKVSIEQILKKFEVLKLPFNHVTYLHFFFALVTSDDRLAD